LAGSLAFFVGQHNRSWTQAKTKFLTRRHKDTKTQRHEGKKKGRKKFTAESAENAEKRKKEKEKEKEKEGQIVLHRFSQIRVPNPAL